MYMCVCVCFSYTYIHTYIYIYINNYTYTPSAEDILLQEPRLPEARLVAEASPLRRPETPQNGPPWAER